MRDGQKHCLPKLHTYRRNLRETLTSAEAALWSLVNNKQLHGRKFRRQHSIENFIADFYCAEEKLIIELDGEVHNDPMQATYDEARDNRLKELGYKVLRFENKMVFQQTEFVLDAITSAFDKREPTSPI
jgi:very-short-patch-repair endonuclease